MNAFWLADNIVLRNHPLKDNPDILKCLELDKPIEETRKKIDTAQDMVKRLTKKQKSLRENLNVGGHDEQNSKWRTQLGENEEKIERLEEETIPSLKKELKTCEEKLRNALKALALEWLEQ